jgi:hypothetical protein
MPHHTSASQINPTVIAGKAKEKAKAKAECEATSPVHLEALPENAVNYMLTCYS